MFAKIFRSMFQGSMYGNPDGIITFMVMLVLAERHGEVDMTPQAIAAITSIPLETIQSGLEYLSRPDRNSRTPGSDGKRIVLLDDHRDWGWKIVNYEYYRQIRSEEERREYQADWARRARAARRDNDKTSTESTRRRQVSTKSTNADADADADADAEGKRERARATRPAKPPPRKRAPENFEPDETLRAWAASNAPDVDLKAETEKFRDWEYRTAHTDWNAAWRTWMRRAQESARPKTNGRDPVRTWAPPADEPDEEAEWRRRNGYAPT